ncbi:hypothetical protein EDB82DRAFT_279619 [Fusarium venenatum]|uniref:uncharacterized protein n=1 Tax=Fusarium venenatum TaxID=56646 RepID=UPI001D534CBB|nr:hypothetical protein EDB82DRAFT_279619 [Fusarium venenatum]
MLVPRLHLQRCEMYIFNTFAPLNREPTVISIDDAKLQATTQDCPLANSTSLESLPSLVLQIQYDKRAARSESPKSLGCGGERGVKEDRQDGDPGFGSKARKRYLINVDGLIPEKRGPRTGDGPNSPPPDEALCKKGFAWRIQYIIQQCHNAAFKMIHDWLGLQLEQKRTEGLWQRRSTDTDKFGHYSTQVGILKQNMVTLKGFCNACATHWECSYT